MKRYIACSTIYRTLLALREGTRLLIWDDKYFLLCSPPRRLTTKVISELIRQGWIDIPHIISSDLAEYKLTEKGHAQVALLCQHGQNSLRAITL